MTTEERFFGRLPLTGYELLTLIEALHDAIVLRLDLALEKQAAQDVGMPLEPVQRSLENMIALHGRAMTLLNSEEDTTPHQDWLDLTDIPDAMWGAITNVLSAEKWDDIIRHSYEEHLDPECKICIHVERASNR